MSGLSFNIVLSARHSLEGLSTGWTDDCYIEVQTASTEEVLAWRKSSSKDEEAAFQELIDTLSKRVLGGQVLSTKDDGAKELVKFEADDASQVLLSLPAYTLKEIMSTCVGLARTKA